MNCPVCNTYADDNALLCPHCQSDLEIYRLILKANERNRLQRRLFSALGLVAVLTAAGWAASGILSNRTPASELPVEELCPDLPLQGETRPMPGDSELIEMLRGENERLKSENTSLSGSKSMHAAAGKTGSQPKHPVKKTKHNKNN